MRHTSDHDSTAVKIHERDEHTPRSESVVAHVYSCVMMYGVVVEKRKTMLLLPMKYTANVDSSCPAMSIHTPLLQIRDDADSGAYIFVVDE